MQHLHAMSQVLSACTLSYQHVVSGEELTCWLPATLVLTLNVMGLATRVVESCAMGLKIAESDLMEIWKCSPGRKQKLECNGESILKISGIKGSQEMLKVREFDRKTR